MKNLWEKNIRTKLGSEEELDAALKECGIPKRIGFKEHPFDTLKAYPFFIEAFEVYDGDFLKETDFGGYLLDENKTITMTIESCNRVLGGKYLKEKDTATSFVGNVLLDILIRKQKA